MSMMESMQRYAAIEQVTSAKDDAPPVYLMDEIADSCKATSEAAVSSADHCARLLAHRNPIVKHKTLRLIRHLCNKGCSQFQRSMQRFVSQIRDLVRYKGESDPFKGDALNERVREAAKEVVELLFSSPAAAPQSYQSVSTQGRIKGFGSSGGPPDAAPISTTSSSGAGGAGGSRMLGFGSCDARAPSTSSYASSQPPGTASASTSSGAGNSASSYGRTFWGAGGGGTGIRSSLTAGEPAGGTTAAGGASGFSNGVAAPAAPPAGYSGLTAAVTSVAGSEELLIEDICSAGGLRSVPDAEDLKRFVFSVNNMDGLRVAELLREKMQAVSWQVVLRALCCLEAVLEQGMTSACGEVAVMFQSDTDPVWQAANSSSLPVRERAAKVLKLLTGDDVKVAPAPELFKKPASRSGAATPAASTSAVSATAPASKDNVDLLGDLTVPDVPAVTMGVPALIPTLMPPPAPQRPLALHNTALPGVSATMSPLPTAAAAATAAAAPSPLLATPVPAQTPAAAQSNGPLEDIFSDFCIAPPPTSLPPSAAYGQFTGAPAGVVPNTYGMQPSTSGAPSTSNGAPSSSAGLFDWDVPAVAGGGAAATASGTMSGGWSGGVPQAAGGMAGGMLGWPAAGPHGSMPAAGPPGLMSAGWANGGGNPQGGVGAGRTSFGWSVAAPQQQQQYGLQQPQQQYGAQQPQQQYGLQQPQQQYGMMAGGGPSLGWTSGASPNGAGGGAGVDLLGGLGGPPQLNHAASYSGSGQGGGYAPAQPGLYPADSFGLLAASGGSVSSAPGAGGNARMAGGLGSAAKPDPSFDFVKGQFGL